MPKPAKPELDEWGDFEPSKRKVSALDTLRKAAEGRIASLLPEKYKRMKASPFAFFRGSVAVMAADLGSQPSSGLAVQLCGDAHVQNLGSFGTAEGHLIFDINDFDETMPGPFEWDVKRMAASIVLAGRDVEQNTASCEDAVEAFVEGYVKTLAFLAEQPLLSAARHKIRRVKSAAVTGALKQSERSTPADLLRKYAEKDGVGKLRLKEEAGVSWRLRGAERKGVLDSLAEYRESLAPERQHFFDFFEQCDAGFRVVGTGSVGLRCYVVLLRKSEDDALFLQIKQEVRSVYESYLKHAQYKHQGLRVVEGTRKIQTSSDLLLGYTRVGDHDFLVRQLSDRKGAVDLKKLRGNGLRSLAEVAGESLARGHARSGDAAAIQDYVGGADKIAKAIVKFAVRYADVTEDDYEAFLKSPRDA